MAEVDQDIQEPPQQDQQDGQTDPTEQYYNYLKKAGADVPPTLDSFKKTLSDDKSARQYYDYVKANHFDAPETYDSFANTLGVKKNGPSLPSVDYSKPVRQNNPSESTGRPNVPLPKLTGKSTADQLTEQHAQAQQLIKTELTGNNDLIPGIIKNQKQQAATLQGASDLSMQPRSDQPLTDAQRQAQQLTPQTQPQTASDQEVSDFAQSVQTDPNAGRGFLNHIIAQKPDKAPALKSAIYLNDAADRSAQDPTKAGKILQNSQQIEKGKLDYSPTSGLLTKPEGLWESIATGAKQKTKSFEDYDFFSKATPTQAVEELEKRMEMSDPDDPVPVPKGFLATMGGGMASQPFKGLAAGKVAGFATGAIPGAEEFAPAADKFVSAAVSSNDFRKMSYANSLQQNYFQLRNQGMEPQEAYDKANGQAKDESMVDAAAGAAMMYGAGAIGEIKLPKFSLSAPFTNTLTTALKQGAKGVGEAGAIGLIQGQAQQLKNELADDKGIQRDTSGKDIGEAVKSGTMFTLGMGVLAKGMDLMSGATKSKLLQGLSKATPDQVNQELGGLIMEGHITPQEAQTASQAIEEHRMSDQSIPPNVTDEARLQIQDKIKRRDYLETQLESADKAFHPEIKEKINKVNDDILELAQNTRPRGEEDILSQKPTDNGQKTNNDAQTEGQVSPEGAANEERAPSIQPVSDQIQPTADLRTWDLGDMEGKPEDEAAKKHIEGVVEKWDAKPATDATEPAKQGGTFGEFTQRVIPAFDKILKTEDANTTIVTHSSVLKAMKVWDEMGRPDVSKLTDDQKKEFATQYNKQETYNGDLETFKGDKGDIHVIRHGQTEDNEKNNFRSGNTNLTSKGKQQAAESGNELGRQTGGNVPKIITSDLPRAIDTSNIIHGTLNGDKPQVGNSIQSPHFEGERSITHVGDDHVVVKDPGGDHIKHEIPISDIKNTQDATNPGEKPRSEDIQRPEVKEGEPSGPQTEQQGDADGKPVSAEKPAGAEGSDDGRLVGPSHGALKKLSEKLGLPDVERGTHLTPEEYADRGRQLLDGGADVSQVEKDFKSGKQPSADDISVARAHLEDLVKKANDIGDDPKKGTKSDEYKAAKSEVQQWRDEVVKPMGTKASEPFTALQGQRDLDTGSFTAIKNAKEDVTGKPVENLPSHIEDLSGKVKDLEDKNKDLESKLQDALNRNAGKTSTPDVKKLSGRLNDLAKRIRTSSEFDNFLKGPLSDVKKMGVDLPRVKEIAASILEDAAKAVKAGEDAAEFIKSAVDKLTDDLDKDKFVDALTNIGQKTGLFDTKETPEEKNIRRLEKELDDIQSGNGKNAPEKRESSVREKELKEQIADAKAKAGLTKSKVLSPEDEADIKREKYESLVGRFEGKRDNKFSAKDSADIWQYAKENYIDNNPDFTTLDMVNKVAMDLGLTPEQVRNALGRTAETKRIIDQLYKNQYEKSKAKRTIERWVNQTKDSAITKLLNTISSPFRGLATLGHGHALLFTHAGMNMFDPAVSKKFFLLLGKQFKIVYGSNALFEKTKNDLRNDPMFTTAVRSGAAVDPNTVYDDWQLATNFLKRLKIQGNKGFLVLKMMRMEIFKNEYNKLSNIEKADPESIKRVAEITNRWTGTAGLKVSPTGNAFIFAPNLIVSKFARLTSDPIHAISTLVNKNASIDDKVAARIIFRKTGRVMATYAAALVANQALLSLAGSNQSVNFTNPFKPDWLKFKAGDKTVDVSSGMASTMQFLAQLGALPFQGKEGVKENYKAGSTGDALKNELTGFIRKTLSPFGSTVWDVLSHKDYSGNVLPMYSDTPGKGKAKLDVMDYVQEKFPIPIADAFKTMHDQMKEDGADDLTINYILGGVLLGGIASTGVKVSTDQSPEKGGTGGGGGAGDQWTPTVNQFK